MAEVTSKITWANDGCWPYPAITFNITGAVNCNIFLCNVQYETYEKWMKFISNEVTELDLKSHSLHLENDILTFISTDDEVDGHMKIHIPWEIMKPHIIKISAHLQIYEEIRPILVKLSPY